MAADIMEIVNRYNKIDPDFCFYPVIIMTETALSEGTIKGVSVEVKVSYETKRGAKGSRQFNQVDTSTNAYMEGKP